MEFLKWFAFGLVFDASFLLCLSRPKTSQIKTQGVDNESHSIPFCTKNHLQIEVDIDIWVPRFISLTFLVEMFTGMGYDEFERDMQQTYLRWRGMGGREYCPSCKGFSFSSLRPLFFSSNPAIGLLTFYLRCSSSRCDLHISDKKNAHVNASFA